MRQIIYTELRKCSSETNKETENGYRYFETINFIRIAEEKARKEGLLDLDPEYGTIAEIVPKDDPWIKILDLVSNGYDADDIAEICLLEYFSKNLQGTDGILSLMRLVGGLAIQAGENPNVIIKKMEAMIPLKYYNEYRKLMDVEIEKNTKSREEKLDLEIEKLCHRPSTYLDEQAMNFADAYLDKVLEQASDSDIKKILENTDNRDLTMALKKMSGVATKKLYDNISKNLFYLLVEEMSYLGPVRGKDVEDAKCRILMVIGKLIRQDKLNPDNFELLSMIMEE